MPGNAERFEKVINQGHDAAWEQDWKRAASFYRQALEESPDNPKALTSLGLALYEQENYADALKHYQRAAELSPDDAVSMGRVAELLERLDQPDQAVEAYLRSAEIYIRTKDIQKAIEQWSHVIQLRPDHLMARSRLALVYERLGRKQEAVAEYLVVGGILQHNGDVQKAAQAVLHAQQILPEAPEPVQALGLLRAGRLLPKPSSGRGMTGPLAAPRRGRDVAAAKSAAGPETPDIITETRQKAMAGLADLLFDQMEDNEEVGRMGMASLIGGESAGDDQADHVRVVLHVSQVVDLQSHQQDAQAIEELERALDAGLDHPAAFFDLGYLYIQANRYESGVRFLQRAAKHPDFALGAHLLLGQTLFRMERVREAVTELLGALKLADMAVVLPEQADGLGQMYDTLIEAQQQQPGKEPPTKVCENILAWLTKPNWREQLKQAREQMGGEDDDTPTPLADMLSESGSAQLVESLSRIKKLARDGKLRTAVEEAYFTMAAAPTYLPLHILIGDVLVQQGLNVEAAEKFAVVARAYNIRGDVGHAISLFRKIADLSPMDMKLRNQLTEMLINNHRLDDAVIEYLRQAEVYYSLADIEMTRKTLDDATRLGQQGVDRDLRLKVLRKVADIELQSLDWRQGIKVYEQIRSLAPDDAAARASLVDLNLRVGQVQPALSEMNNFVNYLLERKSYKQATSFLEGLVDANPTQPAILRQLAEVNRQAGNIEVAVAQLDQVGEKYLAVGNRAAAIETVRTILSLNPPNKAEYTQLLAQLKGD